MEEREQPENHNESRWETVSSGANRWLVLAVVVLLVATGLAFGYGYRQQLAVGHLTAQQSVSDATINQLQGQLNTVTTKLNDMVATQQAAQQAAAQAAAQKKTQVAAVAKRGTVADKRYKQLQTQLEDQQKQLKETQDLVAKNRSDLEGSLGSTRDELNGSIARTHDELVALEKRGERSYFEFDLTKSKQFQRIGPLSLSLRKADTKHKSYEIQMVVDDNHLTKKNVNLYEPIWIHTENEAQPVQIVVNRIDKNEVHGYISAPKYKPSEVSSTSGAAAVTPVSTRPQTPDQNPQNPNQPEQ
jgi:DNA repair exonuclease SbcCD ATPase subunit